MSNSDSGKPFLPPSHTVAITHGSPRPKKTFTELDPVTLPTAESACFSAAAAAILANVSGREVPRATKVMAVTDGKIPNTHPNKFANSPTIKVTNPINPSERKKQGNPPP